MNLKQEIIVMVSQTESECILRFFYSLLRKATSDKESATVIENLIQLFGTD